MIEHYSFTNRSDVDEDSKLFDEIDDYWRDLDDLVYGSNPYIMKYLTNLEMM